MAATQAAPRDNDFMTDLLVGCRSVNSPWRASVPPTDSSGSVPSEKRLRRRREWIYGAHED
jgi:hypothetical protein